MIRLPSEISRCLFLLLSVISGIALGYRPVQFVKHTGDNGRADQAFSVTQYYNESSQQSDLYVRMEAFRYDTSAKGWAALAFGQEMTGALMFILYGDPAAPGAPLTLTVRTIDSHHPPRPIAEMDFYSGPVPDVDITYTHFDEYTGEFFHEGMQKKPSHLGVAEFIVRGFNQWEGCPVSNTTAKQEFIWSSNFKQDFEGDFSLERHIDMHQFGLGFGFVWVDLLNAVTPEPMFGPINDLESHKGVNEIADPLEPTQEELDEGEAYLASHKSDSAAGDGTTDISTSTPTSTALSEIEAAASAAADPTPVAAEEPQPTTSLNPNPEVEQPVHNHTQGTLRDWMWHLHGILMVIAFIILFPVGVYFIRSPRATAFNLHWTVQALGSMSVLVGGIIGYWQSHSISIVHQYIGIVVFIAVGLQVLAGWRHHVSYLKVKQGSWITKAHRYLGRVILPVGMMNVLSGLKLREYSWVVMSLPLAVIVVELVALFIYVRQAKKRSGVRIGGESANNSVPMTGAEAEEYFQLAGDDDEFSDSDGEVDGRKSKVEEEREKAERLRRLDKV